MIKIQEEDWTDAAGVIVRFWRDIKITNRWKVCVTNGESELFLEKKTFFGCSWVSERQIRILDVTETINVCERKPLNS